MNPSLNPKSESWMGRLFGRRRPDPQPTAASAEHRVTFPMLLLAGKNEHDWEPVWNEVVRGAALLGLDHAQLEVRSERGFHTFQYESLDEGTPDPKRSIWEATASLYAGTQLIGRMSFTGRTTESDLSFPFEQLAKIVDRTEDLVPDQLKQSNLVFSNEICLSLVA